MGLRLPDAAAADGSPVLYWALGELDVGGVAREDLADCLLMRQVAHLEDALQASRAISRAAPMVPWYIAVARGETPSSSSSARVSSSRHGFHRRRRHFCRRRSR